MPRTEFYLASIQTNPDKVGEYIQEASQLGVEIKAPDINISNADISIVDNSIYFGLHNVKGVGKQAAIYVVYLRERYKSIRNREHLDDILEDEMIFWEVNRKGKSPKQKLGKGAIDALEQAGCFDNVQECINLQERSVLQKELLGISFVDVYTPLTESFSSAIKGLKPLPEFAEEGLYSGYGIISELDIRKTRADAKPGFANKEYAVATIDWQMNTCKVTCFDLREDLQVGSFWLMRVSINSRGATMKDGKCLTKIEGIAS